ncbi:hypothetical protein HNY73_004496 [Argiope bruennichi]|uniref:Uncharacterized protein n=1 Tax=Argiope bruennichi TaxID=94029 RepID=A0A8T0FQU3_ARGBR|nr:hypothetical protein HNY73_004496 [Argiope bruennichi]
MDPDSTNSPSTCGSSPDQFANIDENYISNFLNTEDNCSTEVIHPSDTSFTTPNDTLERNHDQVTPEETSEMNNINGHSHMSNNESCDENDKDIHNNIPNNGLELAKKFQELMDIEKEAKDLREKLEQSEKEKTQLQLEYDSLKAENYQLKSLKDQEETYKKVIELQKNQKEETNQKVIELQKDLANKSNAQIKLRNEIESCNLQVSEANDSIKKMKNNNKRLWNMVTQFARKLANADLLTVKERNIMKEYGEENDISLNIFDSKAQEEEKDQSLALKNQKDIDIKQNRVLIKSENKTIASDYCLPIQSKESESKNSEIKNEGYQFSQGNSSLVKDQLSSRANCFEKSCSEDEDPVMPDNINIDDLVKMRKQVCIPIDQWPIISPIPQTPNNNRFRQGPPRKDLRVDNPSMIVPFHKSLGQTSESSKNQGSLNEGDSSKPNSSRKLTFCHQQSEGFDVNTEHTNHIFELGTGNSNPDQISGASKNQGVLNVSDSSTPNSSRKLTSSHQQSEGFDVNMEYTNQIFESGTGNSNHNPNPGQTSEASKNQGLLNVGDSSTPNSSRNLTSCHQQSGGSDGNTTNQIFELGAGNSNHNYANANSNTKSPLMRISSKRRHDGTAKIDFNLTTTPITMVVNPNNWKVSYILGPHDIDTDNPLSIQPQRETASVQACGSLTDNLENFEKSEHINNKEHTVERVSSPELTTPVLVSSEQRNFFSVRKPNVSKPDIVNPDISYSNGSKALDAFADQCKNDTNHQHIKNHADDNRFIVPRSCASLSPYKKENELFSQELLSPPHNLCSPVSELKSRKSTNVSNVSKRCSLSVPDVNNNLKKDSTISESTDESKNSPKSSLTKKQKKRSLMPTVESSNIVPARNKGRTLLSRALCSSKNIEKQNANVQKINANNENENANIESANTDIQEKKSENISDENKTSTTFQPDKEKYLLQRQGRIEKQIKLNSSSCSDGSSNCMIKPRDLIEENENIGEAMQQVETLYNNVDNNKEVSRIKVKSSTKIKRKKDLVDISPKKKTKSKELKRIVTLKNEDVESAVQRMEGDVEVKQLIAEEHIDSNFSISNLVENSLERHKSEKYVGDVPPKIDTQHEKKISDIFEMKLKEMDNFSNNSVSSSVESLTKNEDISVVAEESNILVPNSIAYSILENDLEAFNSPKVNNSQNYNKSILAKNQVDISANTDYFNNEVTQQEINAHISNVNKLIKKTESVEIQYSELCKQNSSMEINSLPTNQACNLPLQQNRDSHHTTKSMYNPFQKSSEVSMTLNPPKCSPLKIKSPKLSASKIKSPSKSPAEAKSPDCNSFNSSNNSEVNANFPEVNLPPLPLDPFGLSGNKISTFLHKEKNAGIKSVEPSHDESIKLSASNSNDLSKSVLLPESGSIAETVNNIETNASMLFNHQECVVDNIIDFLLKDEDSNIKSISDAESKDKYSSNSEITIDNSLNETKAEIPPAPSQTISDYLTSSAASSFESTSNTYSTVDMIINNVAVGDITEAEEPKASSQIDSNVIVSSAASSVETISNIDTVIDSVAVGDVEIEVKSQDPLSRTCRKRQTPIVSSSHHADKKKVKGCLKSMDLSTSEESALLVNIKHDSCHISETDSDFDSPLIIAEDFEEVQQSIPVSEVRNSNEKVEFNEELNSMKENSPNKTVNKKQKNRSKKAKKIENKIELPHIEAAFQAIDKIRFTETHFNFHVHELTRILSNPSVIESTPKLAFHLVKYLHTTRKNPLLSFSLSGDPDNLLPPSELCIVKALLAVDTKSKPHLNGLLSFIIEAMYQLVLGKLQYHIYGLSSLCRVMAAICKELNNIVKPRNLCCDLLRYRHKFAPFLVASIVSVYKEAFEVHPDTTEEEEIFLSALSYGVQQKPKTLTETQWKHCSNVFCKYLTVEFCTDISKTIPDLLKFIEDKRKLGYNRNDLLIGVLSICARVNGWSWAQEHLLEAYVLPNLLTYSKEDDGEYDFAFFADLCTEICFDCPDEKLSHTYLMKYWKNPEREFVQIYAGASLLKLLLLRNDLFPEEMQEWITYHHEDHRIVASTRMYFNLRLMVEQDLELHGTMII